MTSSPMSYHMCQELNETRTRTTTTIDEMDSGLREDYESRMQEALQQTRMEYEEQIRVVRDEVEDLFERKVRSHFPGVTDIHFRTSLEETYFCLRFQDTDFNFMIFRSTVYTDKKVFSCTRTTINSICCNLKFGHHIPILMHIE